MGAETNAARIRFSAMTFTVFMVASPDQQPSGQRDREQEEAYDPDDQGDGAHHPGRHHSLVIDDATRMVPGEDGVDKSAPPPGGAVGQSRRLPLRLRL